MGTALKKAAELAQYLFSSVYILFAYIWPKVAEGVIGPLEWALYFGNIGPKGHHLGLTDRPCNLVGQFGTYGGRSCSAGAEKDTY